MHTSTSTLNGLLGSLEHFELQQRGLDSARMRLLAASVDEAMALDAAAERSSIERDLAYRALRSELALALHLGEHRLESEMRLALELVHSYEATLAALDGGAVSLSHARVIVDAGAVIGSGDAPELRERRAGYEGQAIDLAERETPNRLRPMARRLAESWAEKSVDVRHREAVRERRVVVIDGDDGMADLVARLPAIEAHAIKDRLTRIARAAERGERMVRVAAARAASGAEAEAVPRRTRDQLRADVFAELLLASDEFSLFAGSAAEAIRGRVQLIVQQQARDGAESDFGPCELAGYGAISPDSARGPAARAGHWDRVVADVDSGAVLRVERYRPSEALRRLLGARDLHCRFPGCRAPVHRCDLDHTVDAVKGGPTSSDNLAHLCRGHHMLKHHGGWRVQQSLDGLMRWTSPAGRRYVDRPPRVRFSRAIRATGKAPPETTPSETVPPY